MAADFAIAQFRFLTPLLLVHGRWSYKRISRMICFFFFKVGGSQLISGMNGSGSRLEK